MRQWYPALALFGLCSLTLLSCGPAGSPGPMMDQAVITEEEIATAQSVTTALELVERFRPQWLVGRGAVGLSQPNPTERNRTAPPPEADAPVVYLDRRRYGPVDRLREISVARVKQLRFIDAATAETIYGPGHLRGVIEVTTRTDDRK